jgi:hypothetical protein
MTADLQLIRAVALLRSRRTVIDAIGRWRVVFHLNAAGGRAFCIDQLATVKMHVHLPIDGIAPPHATVLEELIYRRRIRTVDGLTIPVNKSWKLVRQWRSEILRSAHGLAIGSRNALVCTPESFLQK